MIKDAFGNDLFPGDAVVFGGKDCCRAATKIGVIIEDKARSIAIREITLWNRSISLKKTFVNKFEKKMDYDKWDLVEVEKKTILIPLAEASVPTDILDLIKKIQDKEVKK